MKLVHSLARAWPRRHWHVHLGGAGRPVQRPSPRRCGLCPHVRSDVRQSRPRDGPHGYPDESHAGDARQDDRRQNPRGTQCPDGRAHAGGGACLTGARNRSSSMSSQRLGQVALCGRLRWARRGMSIRRLVCSTAIHCWSRSRSPCCKPGGVRCWSCGRRRSNCP